jgi:DNA polymerase elongation subunit (family B)
MRKSRAILDIETVGVPFEELDAPAREYMLRRATTPDEEEEVKGSLGLYPLTGFVTAIGLFDPDTDEGAMYYQSPGTHPTLPLEEDGILYETGTEEEILRKFWDYVKDLRSVITYNGRGFDCPYLLVRSAMHQIRPTRDLMPNRYSSNAHIDLMDRLSFFGSVRRNFSLDMWCRAFGIESPKETVHGGEVSRLYAEGRHLDIARYCARDIRATAKLFRIWDEYIAPAPRK